MMFQGQCAYSDQVQREGCSSVEVFKFECPKVKDARHEHPRYPDSKGNYKRRHYNLYLIGYSPSS